MFTAADPSASTGVVDSPAPQLPTIETAPEPASKPEPVATLNPQDSNDDPPPEPYRAGECTMAVTLQLMTADGDAAGRRVIIGVRSHDATPLLRVVREQELGPLPAVIMQQLHRWEAYLPILEQSRQAERARQQAAKAKARHDAKVTTPSPKTTKRPTHPRSPAKPPAALSAAPVRPPPAFDEVTQDSVVSSADQLGLFKVA